MFDKNFTCCFTGHREIEKQHIENLPRVLEAVLRGLISNGYFIFVAGGALGFDTIAAETVLSLKEEFPQLMLKIVAPCADQSETWSESDKRKYERIREAADDYICMSATYNRDCMKRRNLEMVKMSAVCIAYCMRERTGSSQTVAFANQEGLDVIDLIPLLELYNENA